MSIRTYVIAVDPNAVGSLQTDDGEILTVLGPQEEAVAVQLQELFSSVIEAVTASLEAESRLTVEVIGSVSLKAQGGIKHLLFNIGAEAGATGAMKVVLSTTLKPKIEYSQTKESKRTGG